MSYDANFNLSVWKAPTDLVRLRAEIKAGHLEVYIKHDNIYVKDAENGECVFVGTVSEAKERGKYR